jgi:serine/threonine protein kinase
MEPSSTPPPPPSSSPCPRCGAPIPADASEGLCPRCVAAGNFLTGSLFAPAAARADSAGAAPAPSPEELAGLFPQLEIQRLLGRGGMGLVYLARQKSLERLVALKLLAPERADEPAFAKRFAIEAQALARLHHPHIVTVHDFGAAGGYFYLLMEYVDGLNLRQLQQAGRVEPREALAIVPQICDALQYAHDQGVVHRDIKPENILVDRLGQVKVADFGLAKLVASASADPSIPHTSFGIGHSAEGGVMGTPAYMSPEQKSQPDQVDHRTDIYALGAVLYEMLTGARPGTPLKNPSRDVRIDVRLDEVVLRALAHEPSLRWQQASEMKTSLETIAGSPAAPVSTPVAAPAPPQLRRNMLLVGIAGGALALGLFLGRHGSETAPSAATLPPSPTPIPASTPKRAGVGIDLSSAFTPRQVGSKSLTRALDVLHGDQVFDGIGFHIDGQITLAGSALKLRNTQLTYPARVPDLPLLDQTFDELHLLHVTYYDSPHGETVATLRIHYRDGVVAELPIRYGVHIRDWSLRPNEERERLEDPGSKIVFRDLKVNSLGATARIFKTTFANPRPTQPAHSLELVSAEGEASYSLLAASLANHDPARPVTPAVPSGEAARTFNKEILIRVVDRETGAPVAGTLLNTSGIFNGANLSGEPLRTDAKGEARLRFPRGKIATGRVVAELASPGSGSRQWQSWESQTPRIAYFFVDDSNWERAMAKSKHSNLPAWRIPLARALLREHSESSLASRKPGQPDDINSKRIDDSIADSFADLGALAQGTKGEALFQAAMVRTSGPSGTSSQNLISKDPDAYRLIYGARDAAESAFLSWMLKQVEPDATPVPGPEAYPLVKPTAFRPLDPDRVIELLADYEKLERPPAKADDRDAQDAKRHAIVQALMDTLQGTAFDYELETSGSFTVGDSPALGPSARVHHLLSDMITALRDHGVPAELSLRMQQRDMLETLLIEPLQDMNKSGKLRQILADSSARSKPPAAATSP